MGSSHAGDLSIMRKIVPLFRIYRLEKIRGSKNSRRKKTEKLWYVEEGVYASEVEKGAMCGDLIVPGIMRRARERETDPNVAFASEPVVYAGIEAIRREDKCPKQKSR